MKTTYNPFPSLLSLAQIATKTLFVSRAVIIFCLGIIASNATAQSFKARFFNPHVYRTRVDLKAVRVAQVRRKAADGKSLEQGFWITARDSVSIQVDATTPTPPAAVSPGGVPPAGGIDKFLDYKVISEDENGFVIIRVLPRVALTAVPVPTSDSSTTTTTTVTTPSTTTTSISVTTPAATRTTKTTNTTTPPTTAVPSTTTVTSTTTTSVVPTRQKWVVRRLATANSQVKGDPANAYNYLFAIKKDAFPTLGKTYMGGKFWGTPVVHPFKLRPGQANLGPKLYTDITISYTVGYRARLSKNPLKERFVTFIPLGVGVGAAKHRRELPDNTLSEEKDAAAITYWQGGVFFTFQKLGIGAFVGLDAMIGHKNDWIYQSKPWFSFGIGYKFKDD